MLPRQPYIAAENVVAMRLLFKLLTIKRNSSDGNKQALAWKIYLFYTFITCLRARVFLVSCLLHLLVVR